MPNPYLRGSDPLLFEEGRGHEGEEEARGERALRLTGTGTWRVRAEKGSSNSGSPGCRAMHKLLKGAIGWLGPPGSQGANNILI